MANEANLKPFKIGNPGGGRPKGTKNRSTIAKMVLEMSAKYPEDVFNQLQKLYPTINKDCTMEEMMTIVQADKAIRKRDSFAYEKILDSAYGKPKGDDQASIDIQGASRIVINLNKEDGKSDDM